jgi:hypothetical protein
VSFEFARPFYQSGVSGIQTTQPDQSFIDEDTIPPQTWIDVPAYYAGRNVPDISFNADPDTGYVVYYTSSVTGFSKQTFWGGTSFVGPQLNGVMGPYRTVPGDPHRAPERADVPARHRPGRLYGRWRTVQCDQVRQQRLLLGPRRLQPCRRYRDTRCRQLCGGLEEDLLRVCASREALISRWTQARDFVLSNADALEIRRHIEERYALWRALEEREEEATHRPAAPLPRLAARLAAWRSRFGREPGLLKDIDLTDGRTAPAQRAPHRYRASPGGLHRALGCR